MTKTTKTISVATMCQLAF